MKSPTPMKQRATLPLSELAAGMLVAAPVTDPSGHLLLPVGATISDAILGSLGRHEVAEVCVEMDVVEDPAQHAAREAAVTASVTALFRHAGEGSATKALHDAVLAFRMTAP